MDPKTDVYDNFTNYSIPTPPDAEDVTPTDKISPSIAKIIDNLGGSNKDTVKAKSSPRNNL